MPFQPHLPPQAPGPERGRFPVVLDQAHVVHQAGPAPARRGSRGTDQDRQRRGFDHHLVLVVVLQAEGILAVAPVGRPARGLHVRGAPRLRSHGTQEGRGVKRAGADFHVVSCRMRHPASRPVVLQGEDQLLERARRAADFMEGLSDPKERASIRRAPYSGPPRPAAGTDTPHLAPKARVSRLPLCENPRRPLPAAREWCNNPWAPHQHGGKQHSISLLTADSLWRRPWHGTLQYQGTSPASHTSPFGSRRELYPFSGGDMTPSDVLKLIKEKQAKFATCASRTRAARSST